jgi:hypothetical protein
LAELDERQIFLDLGFSSLFEYCVEALGLSESTAGRHIAAARVCRSYPQVFDRVASGALHASALSLLRKHLTSENAAELFELCAHRSARKVEELLAARFPRPDVRDLVRRLPAQGPTLDVGSASVMPTEAPPRKPTAPLQTAFVESRSSEPSTSLGAAEATRAPKARRLEPLSADRYGVHFTADGEFRELLERVRGLAAHRLPSGDLMTLIKRGLEAYERELMKERFGLGRKPRGSRGVAPSSAASAAPSSSAASAAPSSSAASAAPSSSAASVPPSETTTAPLSETTTALAKPELSAPEPTNLEIQLTLNPNPNPNPKRRCPAAVARAVFVRDGRQCSYVSAEGRRCRARWCLELDHVDPWAVGGECTIENLRLRCRAHNQRYARLYFGKSRVEAAVQHHRWRRRTAGRSPSG